MRLTVRIRWSASPDRRFPLLAPPFRRSPSPARRRSISAQSAGAEHAITTPRSFSTQRKAGMSSFEPSRIPAWLAPVCEERSVSHSTKRCDPSASQRAIVGAFPSRIARWSTGFARPSISRIHDARDFRLDALARAPRNALNHPDHVRVVLVRPGHHLEHRRDRRDDQRSEDSRPQSAYFDRALRERVDDTEYDGVEQEEQEKRRRNGVRKTQRSDDSVRETAFSAAISSAASNASQKSPTSKPGRIPAPRKTLAALTKSARSNLAGRSGGLTSVRRGRLPYVEAPSSGGDMGGP